MLVFGPAKNKVRKAMKHALNTDQRPSILMSCDELHKAIHDMRSDKYNTVLDEHCTSDHR